MKKIRQYLLIDVKYLTATEFYIDTNDFGEPYIVRSLDIVAFGECKKYAVPVVIFVDKVAAFREDINNELCEYVQGGYNEMIENYKRMQY